MRTVLHKICTEREKGEDIMKHNRPVCLFNTADVDVDGNQSQKKKSKNVFFVGSEDWYVVYFIKNAKTRSAYGSSQCGKKMKI